MNVLKLIAGINDLAANAGRCYNAFDEAGHAYEGACNDVLYLIDRIEKKEPQSARSLLDQLGWEEPSEVQQVVNLRHNEKKDNFMNVMKDEMITVVIVGNNAGIFPSESPRLLRKVIYALQCRLVSIEDPPQKTYQELEDEIIGPDSYESVEFCFENEGLFSVSKSGTTSVPVLDEFVYYR